MSAVDPLAKPKPSPRDAASHRTIAWLVLLTSFALFCLLVYGLFQLGGFIYNDSTMSVSATVYRDTGTDLAVKKVSSASYTALDPDQSNEVKSDVSEGDIIRTGIDTQARIVFPDGSVVHVFPNTYLAIKQIKASRFSKEDISIQLTQEPVLNTGSRQGSYIIAEMPSAALNGYHSSQMTVDSCATVESACATIASVIINQASRVRIFTGPDPNSPSGTSYSRAVVLFGAATMRNAQDAASDAVNVDLYKMATVGLGGSGSPNIADAWDELLTDGSFSREGVADASLSTGLWGPVVYSQGQDAANTPNGQVSITDTLVYSQQAHAAHFYRDSGNTDYALVSIGQQLNLDLAPYAPGGTLRLSADVKLINQQPLGGGSSGVEYPIVFKLTYQNADNNGEPAWQYGYYFVPDPTHAVSPDLGQQVTGNQWVHVEIPNLLAISQLKDMKRIVRLEVYAAGHEYDALITNISLAAR